MSRFLELGYIRVLIDKNMLQLIDFERFIPMRPGPLARQGRMRAWSDDVLLKIGHDRADESGAAERQRAIPRPARALHDDRERRDRDGDM